MAPATRAEYARDSCWSARNRHRTAPFRTRAFVSANSPYADISRYLSDVLLVRGGMALIVISVTVVLLMIGGKMDRSG